MPTALVVDDNENIRRLVTLVLQRLDLDTDEAVDGSEALRKLGEHTYDVIILDLMMPTTGFDVIRALQQTAPEVLDRIIVMTAATGHLADELLSCIRRKITKPFTIAELSRVVKECIKEQQAGRGPSGDR